MDPLSLISHLGTVPFFNVLLPFLPVLLVWSLFWKGLALWHSAQHGQPLWFLILLVVNTIGLLEIVYLFFILRLQLEDLFSNRHQSKGRPEHEPHPGDKM